MDMFFLVTSISDNWQWRDFGGSPKDGVGPSQQDTINEAVENIQCSGGFSSNSLNDYTFEHGVGGWREESPSCEHGGSHSEPVQHPATDARTVATVILQNYLNFLTETLTFFSMALYIV